MTTGRKTEARTASGYGSDNKLPCKARENVTLRPASFCRVGGKFIIHDKAFDYFAFRQGYVQLKGNARFTFSFLCQRNHKHKPIYHSLRRKYFKKNPLFPYDIYDEFSRDHFTEEECIAEFRVEKNDLPVLADALGIPPVFRCSQRSVFEGMEGLSMLLKRLAYPCRYSDMIPRFGRPVQKLA